VIARGWAQQSITGANLGWPGEFGLKVELNRKNVVDVVTRDVWILGAVNSISYFGASFVYVVKFLFSSSSVVSAFFLFLYS